MLNGNITLKEKDGFITLIAEKNNTTILELPLEDDYYNHDIYSFAKNLMGQCMEIINNTDGEDAIIEAIQSELDDNYRTYEICGLEEG